VPRLSGSAEPLAPPLRKYGVVSPSERFIAALAGTVLLAMLVVGARLSPSRAGHGTHEQLGMPACGFLIATGRPCPTCGMTTAVSLAAHRQPVRALLTQPFGALVALGAGIGFWGCLHVAVFGSRLGRVAEPLLRPRIMWVGATLAGLSWVYTLTTWRG
jgi:hypothetical protein